MSMLSVIIPAYNAGMTLERAVNSVLPQLSDEDELIIINDGSRDSTAQIMRACAGRDERIRGYSVENAGVSSARNLGMDYARGDFLLFLDADDEYTPDGIEKLRAMMDKNPCDAVFAGYTTVYNSNSAAVYPPFCDALTGRDSIIRDFIAPVYLSGNNGYMGSCCGRLLRRDIIKNNNIKFNINVSMAEDLLFITEYLFYCNKICALNECIYNYYLTGASATKKFKPELGNNHREFDAAMDKILLAAGYPYRESAAGARSIADVISLIINETRPGNPKGLFGRACAAAGAGRENREIIRAYKPRGRTMKIKRLIALSPTLSVCFFLVRYIQRLLGAEF